MDSALCVHHSALNIGSTTCHAVKLARPYSSFRPSSLSLVSKASTYRCLSRHSLISSPVIRAHKKSSPPWPDYNKDDVERIVRMVYMSSASVVLACVLGAVNCNYIFSPNAIAAPSFDSSSSPSFNSSSEDSDVVVATMPKPALESMWTVTSHLAEPKSERHWRRTPQLSINERPTKDQLKQFKIDVAKLIESHGYVVAEEQLIRLYKDMENKEAYIPAYEVDMVLVLVLILQGKIEKYEEARKRDCLSDSQKYKEARKRDCLSDRADARVHIYKAIIHTMLEEDDDAEKYWNEFTRPITSKTPHPIPEGPKFAIAN